MRELREILNCLNDKEIISLPLGKLEEIYQGNIKEKPWKVLNPDPNIDYRGFFFQILNSGDKKFVYQGEKTYKRSTGEQQSDFLAFDIPDIYSPNSINKEKGRFSFQYEDTRINTNNSNYRRILFFYAEGTTTKTILDYFKGNKVKLKEGSIATLLNKNGNPEGFTYIYDYDTETYYFANMKDGLPHGFVFSFTSKDKAYVFKDAYIYYEGKKTNLLEDYLGKLRAYNKKYNLSVISWS